MLRLSDRRLVAVLLFILVVSYLFLAEEDTGKTNKLMMDSWETLSNNRFAYQDTCPISSLSQRSQQELQQRKYALPRAHVTHEPLWLPQHCYLPPGGFSSWKTGLVTTLLPHRVPWMCNKLLLRKELTQRENKWIKETNSMWTEDIQTLISNTRNCSWVRGEFSNLYYTTDKERDFPIAYAMNIYHSAHQILRFLKAIYRPHNVYCLHFDLKSSHAFKEVMFSLASCLDNVIIPRKIEDVYRGWYTLVHAQRSCFSDLMLVRETYPWKYVITLCGMELPLRTNAELVSLLKPLNGTSSVKLVGKDGHDEFKYRWKWSLNKKTGWISMKDQQLGPPPGHLKVYKSWAYVALSLQFVEYYLCNETAIALLDYMKDVRIPEENIYPMLFMQEDIPGGYRAEYKDKIFQVIVIGTVLTQAE